MDKKDFWEGQHLAEASHERVKKVDDWFFRFESLWNKMKKQQTDMKNELLKDSR